MVYRDVNFICRDVSCICRDANFIRDVSLMHCVANIVYRDANFLCRYAENLSGVNT